MKNEKRAHKATYSRDRKKGGYIIRVEGPSAALFAGRDVPVTRRDGSEEYEHLESLLWSGEDKETGSPVALYKFTAKPRETADDVVF